MNNAFNTRADTVSMLAPAGGVIGGRFYKFGKLFGCAVASAAAGRPFTLDIWAAFTVRLAAADTDVNIGDLLYLANDGTITDAVNGDPVGIVGGMINGEFGRPDQPLIADGAAGEISMIVK